ncbi:MAG: hypothetical protein MI923_24790 [Phycisphaerales bacterium]|nr:hypothetical protein [Phycisphaerales bacterium]
MAASLAEAKQIRLKLRASLPGALGNAGCSECSRVFSFLEGEISSDDLITDAETQAEISEAHFYVARVMMNAGRNSDALSHLKACIRPQQVNTLEYILANIPVSAFEEKVASRTTPDDHDAQR